MPDFDTSLDDSSEGLQGAALRTSQLADAMQNARLPGPPLAVNPPPSYSPVPGTGVMYATNGPAANFSTALTGPGGAPLPANAQNVRFVQGPPPEDPETQMMRKFLSAIPVDQAEKAISVARQMYAQRAYNKRREAGIDPAQNLQQFMVESGAFSGGLGTKSSDAIRAMDAMARFSKDTAQPTWVPANTATGQPGYFGGAGMRPLIPPRPPEPPTAIREIDEIQKSEENATKAERSGNAALAIKLRDRAALLREQMKGQNVTTGYDDQGRPIVTVGKGAGQATVATASRAQQKLQKYENATEIINRLQNGLEAGHVGVAGMAGEYLWDRGLVQLANLLGDETAQANPERVNSRAGLIMVRESLMREISDDPRFSNVDREEIAKALPSSGAFESLSDAKTKLKTVRDIISKRAEVYANSLGMPAPLWSQSPEKIKAAFKAGKITEQQAIQALTRFH